MPQIKIIENFFQKPSTVPELDLWIEKRHEGLPRFTFTEQEALKEVWQLGEDIHLREDSRFLEVDFPGGQWQLQEETLVNERLYNFLLDQTQDSFSLAHLLDQFNQDLPSSTVIFCPTDERFRLNSANPEEVVVSLAESGMAVSLSEKQKVLLEEISNQFLEINRINLTTDFQSEFERKWSSETLATSDLAAWLLTQPDWARVSKDYWLPRKFLPAPVVPHRYAVRSAIGGKYEQVPPGDDKDATSTETEEPNRAGKAAFSQPRLRQDTPGATNWQTVLRTVHLNEGYVPVPQPNRSLYPRARKLEKIIALQALWFEDGTNFRVWLDTTRHRIFGTELLQYLEYLDLGTILENHWTQAGLTFRLAGHNLEVAEEETRLVDLAGLSGNGTDRLESYRVSLRGLLSKGPLTFVALYEQLANRQEHKPNRQTVGSVLSGSPEFSYTSHDKEWTLIETVTNEDGAQGLRNVTLLGKNTARSSEGEGNMGEGSPRLKELISINRQKLAVLREALKKK